MSTGVMLERLVPEYVKAFEPYIPSKPDPELMKIFGCKHIIRLNNNENPLGPPPKAQQAIASFPPKNAAIYPSGDCYYLRHALAERLGVGPDQILVGNGANEVITFVIKAFCEQGDNIITADKTFAVYEWVATFSGFEARLVPLKDLTFDDQGMLEAIDEHTKIIFVCNPNNPTGTYWSTQRMEAFLQAVGGRQIVVIDEAYYEFVTHQDYPDGVELMKRYPNVVVFRTFSKMYGLAGLRIGYLVGSPEVVDIIRRTCVVYSVNALAQVAALAALEDPEHIPRTRQMVAEGKQILCNGLRKMGLEPIEGVANYIMVRLPISDTIAYRKLMRQGVMVRTMSGFRFPNYIRITISLPEHMHACLETLERVLSA